VVDEVGADRVVDAQVEGQLELGADAVGGADQDGLGPFPEVELEKGAEAADAAQDTAVEGALGEVLDAVLGAVAGGDVDAGVGVGDGLAGGFRGFWVRFRQVGPSGGDKLRPAEAVRKD